ncbi:ABC transporter transmembrane domain-containing protein [Mariniblastus fucicola]|uniref:ABC transporter transmembrane domain-containing protein n=1 Tax=Mariniblastus fucicola TaxID=980251 RepID=UPI0009464F9B|nr:ABC transporter ATP-binding protein [Mariniblastus fucicola]
MAFSANRVNSGLADAVRGDAPVPLVEKLNAVGRQFGIRLRPMAGKFSDLVSTVTDSGPVFLLPSDFDIAAEDLDRLMLVLETAGRGDFLVHADGVDQRVSSRNLKRNANLSKNRTVQWLLVQPVLAAGHASRFNYDGSESPEPLEPLKRLMAFLKPEAGDIRSILVFSIVTGLLSLTTPLAVEAVVNTIAFGRYLQPLVVLSLIVLVFLGFRAILNVLMTVVVEYIQRKIFVRTVEDLAYRLTRVPFSTWNTYHGPELVNRFFDVFNVQKITAKLLLSTLMLLLQTVIGLSVLAFYHPFLLGYDIGLLALMTIILWFIGRGAVETAKRESQLKYKTAAWLQEIVRHPSTFRFNGGLGYAINRADELAANYINERRSHFKIVIRQISFAMAMQVIAATVLLALGGYLVIEGQMTLGQLVAAELIVTVILGSFAKLGKDLEGFYDLLASVDKLGKLFDLPIEPANKLQLARKSGANSLELVNIKLDAASTSQSTIPIEAGTSIAIHGSTELRRSKLLEAMVGQLKPVGGHVMLEDFRVDSLSAESLQEQVSMIREVEVFDGTIDENIRVGRQDIGSDQVNDVIGKLNLQKTLSALEHGLRSRLAVSGYPLSQGQAIRLVLARSLISRPGIMFVDGLLDRLSDSDTIDVLNRLKPFQQHTTIVISTGRKVIADWADNNLNISLPSWELAKSPG